jgi:hypothetical protein
MRTISTAMPNNLQAEFCMAPASEEGKGKMQLSCFPKMFPSREQDCRFLLLQFHVLPENCCFTSLFATVYKRLPEGGQRLVCCQLARGLAACEAAAADDAG